MTANVIYDNAYDKKHLDLCKFKDKIFINYINFGTIKGRKEAYKIKSNYAAKENPFVELLDDNNQLIKVFYSEEKNGITQFINYMMYDKNSI